ncbi:polysaccharide deacetylase family protein [Spirosoma fluminis]
MRWIACALLLITFGATAQKRIAVTIDDLPTVSKYYVDAPGKRLLTQRLLAHCTTYQVPAVGFVIGSFLQADAKPDTSQLGLLSLWLNAGLELGNHTFDHKDYNLVSFDELKADVLAGEQPVKAFLGKQGKSYRYFRHPYLRKGDSQARKDSLEAFLKRHGYQEAPVTVDNSDWLFSRAYDHALLLHDTTLAAEVGKHYVAYMSDCVRYYEAQSDSLFARQIPQVLLLHANTINADYLGQLFNQLRRAGYQFVTLEEALQDAAYQSSDRYYGKGGISWLHRWALTQGEKGAFFKGEPEVPAMIDELANRKL